MHWTTGSTHQFWDIHTGECLETLDWVNSEGHKGVVRNLMFDTWLMVSGGDDKAIKVRRRVLYP